MMREPRRGYKCGRVQCETCGGFRYVDNGPCLADRMNGIDPATPMPEPCPACEDGWQKAEQSYPLEPHKPGARRNALGWEIGTNPADLCPACERYVIKYSVEELDGLVHSPDRSPDEEE